MIKNQISQASAIALLALVAGWHGQSAWAEVLDAPERPVDHLERAGQHEANDEYVRALQVIRAGLARTPRHRGLLESEARLLIAMHDYEGALAANRKSIKSRPRPTSEERKRIREYMSSLRRTRRTRLRLDVVGGPATVYFDRRAVGPVCVDTTRCERGLIPGKPYEVVVERPGFEPWRRDIVAKNRRVVTLEATLKERPSALSVEVRSPADAEVFLDGERVGTGAHSLEAVPAGPHVIEVRAADFEAQKREIHLELGRPKKVSVTLSELVPVRIGPPDAAHELFLDEQPVTLDTAGRLRVPPGSLRLAIRADGYREAVVDLGERSPRTPIELSLRPLPPPPVPIPGWGTGKITAVATTGGLTLIGLGLSLGYGISGIHAWRKVHGLCNLTSTDAQCDTEEGKKYLDRAPIHLNRASQLLVGGLAMSVTTLALVHINERMPARGRWSWHRKVSLVGTSALVISSLATGGELVWRAQERWRKAKAEADPLDRDSLVTQAQLDADNATLAFALAGVSAAASALLLFTLPRRLQVTPSVSADNLQLRLTVRF